MMNAPRPVSDAQMRYLKPLVKAFSRFHVWLYKQSGGRLFGRLQGTEICIVRMTGARSGAVREFPLMYIPHGDDVLLVASFAGAPRHPVWYHNLVKHPEIEVIVGGVARRMIARLADAAEKAERWPHCCTAYPDFRRYQARTVRDIPVFICAPAGD